MTTTEMTINQEVSRALSTDKPKRGKLAKAAPKTANVPANDDPVAELRQLVLRHRSLTQKGVSIAQMASDVKLKNGEVRECNLPVDKQEELKLVAKHMSDAASKLEREMIAQLKRIPIYRVFLSEVYGVGPIAAAYLVVRIDIHKAVKISNLRRFVGLAVIDGRLERYQRYHRGQQAHHVPELRMRLYQMMVAMAKNAARKTKDRPNGTTTKYLKVWADYVHRMMHSARYNAQNNTLREWNPSDIMLKSGGQEDLWSKTAQSGSEDDEAILMGSSGCEIHNAGDRNLAEAGGSKRGSPQNRMQQTGRAIDEPSGSETAAAGSVGDANAETKKRAEVQTQDAITRERPAAKALIYGTAWRKGAEVFIEDLYTVWRALEGLPVWGSYYAEKLGYLHGGQPAMRGPRSLTVEQALEMVGCVGPQALDERQRLMLSVGSYDVAKELEGDED